MYKNSYENEKFRVQVHYKTKFLRMSIPMHTYIMSLHLNFCCASFQIFQRSLSVLFRVVLTFPLNIWIALNISPNWITMCNFCEQKGAEGFNAINNTQPICSAVHNDKAN
jgi:hypothetical protein